MMETLPHDVLVHVLDYIDVVAKIQLAQSNTVFQKRVYRDCPQTWQCMDFCVVPESLCQHVTDAQLSCLLIRVNAHQVTVNLDLSGCTRIRGNGLAPLRNSRVLETVTLLDTTSIQQNPMPALWILRTMFPYNLAVVRIQGGDKTTSKSTCCGVSQSFTRNKVATSHGTSDNMHACQELVMEESRQVIPSFHGVPSTLCFQCDLHYCRRASCPTTYE